MRGSNWLIKLLLVLPVLLLTVLLTGMTLDWWRNNHQDTEAGQTAVYAETDALLSSEPRTDGENQSREEDAAGETAENEVIHVETEEKTAETEPAEPVLHLLFAGDIYLSSHVLSAYDKSGGIDGVLDQGFREEIQKADVFMVNQEFPFSDRGTPAQDKQFTFRLPMNRIQIMNELGVDLVTLANNHTLDYGVDALLDTCAGLDAAGIPYVGAGSDIDRAKRLVTMDVGGCTAGYLAASRVYPDWSWEAGKDRPGMVSGYTPEILLEEVKKAGELCDYLTVYVHWGIEKDELPQEYQRTLGQQLIDAGADLVIGSHPHVLQGIEYYNGKPIVYSLGNFVFGSSIPKTALLRADVNLNLGETVLSVVPGTSGAGYTKRITDPDKVLQFYQELEGISFGITIDEEGIVHPEK